ncbi:ABC transporter permease [Paralcaligenes ureilyticus]|uniref:NitT/TauT family transport system permease protein/sulfonate transport system permease protein n=1 Tax=Paralcaligenes ureilyticus TaxID=627131 RepID=A0A4R3M3N5_9BURK|nr:ABC transporter permease subunit [Paralcaligenes ureilyticus]TCT07396.1 NitT/TauT family transport system permease protein/sulfonate transport system permease protein [Paralcaligenes ureilyticus]
MNMQKSEPRANWQQDMLGRFLGELLVVLFLAIWWITALGLPDFVLPGPWPVAKRLFELLRDPEFLDNALVSTVRVVLSVLIACLIGGVLAFIANTLPVCDGVINERIKPFLNSFPSIGWAILAAIWFKAGNFGVVFVQVAILIPFCLINIDQGFRSIDKELIEMGRSFTRKPTRIWLRINLRLLTPFILAAIKISYGIAWKIALVAELLGAPNGLGYLMLQAQSTAETVTFLAVCFSIVFIFMLGDRLILAPLEKRFPVTK